MSLAGDTIKQQNCKSCNIIRYEQKDAYLGYNKKNILSRLVEIQLEGVRERLLAVKLNTAVAPLEKQRDASTSRLR